MFGIKFGPELIFMLPIALVADSIPIIADCFAIPDFGIGELIGLVFIMPWLIIRGKKNIARGKGPFGFVKNLMTSNQGKFIVAPVGEIIPYFNSLPMWTMLVLMNLDEDGPPQPQSAPQASPLKNSSAE